MASNVIKFAFLIALIVAGSFEIVAASKAAQDPDKGTGAVYGGGRGGLRLIRTIDTSFTDADDKQAFDQSYYQGYLVKLQRGKTYYFRMESVNGNFKPFAWLQRPNKTDPIHPQNALFDAQAKGKELWFSYNSPNGGSFLLIANTEKRGQTGDYKLEIYEGAK